MFLEPALGKENILNFKPVKAGNVSCVKKKGKYFLEFTRTGRIDRFCQKVFKVPPKTTLEIDDIGKKVWSLCDGERTLEDVAEGLEKEFGHRIKPAIPRLLTFMKMLSQNQLIKWNR